MDGQELPVKLCVTCGVDQKLHVFFRVVEEFIYGGGDDVSPQLEITMIADNGDRVVLKEHQTPKQSWDAKANRQYFMCARQLPDMDDTRGQTP